MEYESIIEKSPDVENQPSIVITTTGIEKTTFTTLKEASEQIGRRRLWSIFKTLTGGGSIIIGLTGEITLSLTYLMDKNPSLNTQLYLPSAVSLLFLTGMGWYMAKDGVYEDNKLVSDAKTLNSTTAQLTQLTAETEKQFIENFPTTS